ncbi:C3 and PZP-like alpha-2-macroglobulin domain-containing protein 8 isoform X2 [Anopheles moucheti]|uniref:C3 and PZP-like alpha-2-macroglobulin domain-containing protein 8 isoform X2 n=1 Tax=Anopheles moucheti TaxID=186751 RepID=UPI0022F035FD|nr:C3 and PZP-like alpha-2-macroglobulin domain-containing protein 8 isoform X2 [Anopheles moucheti]
MANIEPGTHRRFKEKKILTNHPAATDAHEAEQNVVKCEEEKQSEENVTSTTATTASANSSTAENTATVYSTTPSIARHDPIELETEDKLEYRFVPAGNGVVNFKVRAPNDAHIALTTNPNESDPMLEVFIGGWKNTKSVIRKNRTKPDVAEVETPDILNAGEFRGFWIRWLDNVITVGMEGSAAAFLSFENPEPYPINCVGVCTGWGASGSWLIEPVSEQASPSAPTAAALHGGGGGAACWVAAANGEIPPNAVVGGSDGEDMYIGRAQHEGGIIPGKVVASHGVCYIAWGGVENPKAEYEVLCDFHGEFVPVAGGDIPPTALPAGESEEGEPLFIGRVMHEGTLTVGKVQPSHGVCYIPYGGQELAFAEYEIYVNP